MKVKVYNISGQEVEEMKISDSVFGVAVNDELVHQAYVAQSANKRVAIAHTKTRGERAGSGIKPWRQKGTGRARVGSVRTPVWRKGGIVFGPRSDRNFKKKINQKMKVSAIKMVLSGKLRDQKLAVLENYSVKKEKTKEMAALLKNLKIKDRVVMAFSPEEKDKRILSRNLKNVSNALTHQLSVAQMLDNQYLLMSKASIKYLEEKYGSGKAS